MMRDYDWPLILILLVMVLAFACLLAVVILGDRPDVHRWVDEQYAVVCWEKEDALACLPESEVLPR